MKRLAFFILIFLTIFSVNVFAQEGLTSYWKLDNNVLDSQLLNNGTRHNFTDGWVSGKLGNALEFNSTAEQYVDFGNDTSLNFGSSDFSIELWINKNILTSDLIDKVNGDGKGYSLIISNDVIDFSIGNGTNIIECFSYLLNNETWYHIVGVKNEDSCSIYVNGTNDTETSNPASIGSIDNIENLTFGKDMGVSYFNGSLDNVRIWNKSLNYSEVECLYTNDSLCVLVVCDINMTFSSDNWITNVTNHYLEINDTDKVWIFANNNASLYLNDEWVSNPIVGQSLAKGVYIAFANTSCGNNTQYIFVSTPVPETLSLTGGGPIGSLATQNVTQNVSAATGNAIFTAENLVGAWNSMTDLSKTVLWILILVIIIIAIVTYRRKYKKFKH